MNKLTLVAFLAVVAFGSSAHAAISLEGQQNIEYYMGQERQFGGALAGTPCGTTCPCPVECPCVPTCCPANRGLFDGGMCCGGQAVPPLCGRLFGC